MLTRAFVEEEASSLRRSDVWPRARLESFIDTASRPYLSYAACDISAIASPSFSALKAFADC